MRVFMGFNVCITYIWCYLFNFKKSRDPMLLDRSMPAALILVENVCSFSMHTLSRSDATPYPYGEGQITGQLVCQRVSRFG